MGFRVHCKKLTPTLLGFLMLVCVTRVLQAQPAQTKKPNIVVIMTDDVGIWNISAYHRGMMGGSTPNIAVDDGASHPDWVSIP
jgi:hypothetical protein